jgi:isopentenyldiphosphate isomerase
MDGPGEEEELVDVLDEMGNVTGTASRREVRAGNLLHRSVFIAVVNDNDELLVHRRASWKDVWPDSWDIAVGGVVSAGEAWGGGAARAGVQGVGGSVVLGEHGVGG